MRKLVAGCALSTVFLFNCDLIFGPSFEFGEAEMRSAVEGTWEVTPRSGEKLRFTIKQGGDSDRHSARSFVPAAQACGSRSFIKSASACIHMSQMPLELVALDGHHVLGGQLVVDGTRFDRGDLLLTIDAAS